MVITATRNNEHEEKDSEGRVIRSERSYGSYSRSFDISGVGAEKISASYTDGVLKLTMPKRQPEEPQVKRLEIK
jgi:HSP20 family protein